MLFRVRDPKLSHRLEMLDRSVKAAVLERGERIHAAKIGVEMILLPLVDGGRQAVRLLHVERP